jgi:hypothetical protein
MQCEIEIRTNRPDACITLTVRSHAGITPLGARQLMADAFPRLMRWMRQQTGTTLEYYAVCERHKSGYPHLHVALRGWKFVWQPKISAKWQQLTGAKIVWIDGTGDPKKVARYLSKYLGKDLTKIGSFKRYWKSRGWVLDRGDETDERYERKVWKYAKQRVAELISIALCDKYMYLGFDERSRTHLLMLPGRALVGARGPP